MRQGPPPGPPQSAPLKLEEAHARATALFSEYEIKPEKFAGIHGYLDADLRSDAAEVIRLEKKFARLREENPSAARMKEYSDVLEAIAFEHGELSGWFGLNSRVIKTARYDDYVNKIDLIVDVEGAKEAFSPLALGIDITFGSHDLHNKFAAIRASIDEGKLGYVKYFLYNHPDKIAAGPLLNVPRVVIGTEIDRVKELGFLWMNQKKAQLGAHPVQRLFLQEAALQLRTFAEYAKRVGQNNLAVILEGELQKVERLMKEKREAGIGSVDDDKVFGEIKRSLAAVFEN